MADDVRDQRSALLTGTHAAAASHPHVAATGPRGPDAPVLPHRMALLAVLLSGLAPGTGHAYVGRPLRGMAFVALLLGAFVLWVRWLPRSYDLARLGLVLLCLCTIALLGDAGQLARKSPRPFVARASNRGWVYAGLVLLTGLVGPMALWAWLASEVAVRRVPDESMSPAVKEDDWVIVDRKPDDAVKRGDVVFLEGHDLPRFARVVGLPGERVGVRRGVVTLEGAEWSEDFQRRGRGHVLQAAPRVVPEAEVLLLPDRRDVSDAPVGARADSLSGRLTWILLPRDNEVWRLGETVR